MAVVSVVVGATSASTGTVVAKIDTGPGVRIAVADNSAMTSPTFYGPVTADAQGVAKIPASGLDADTRYFYQVEDNGVLDTSVTGQFRTHPTLGEPADFTFALASCAGSNPGTPGTGAVLDANRLSNSAVFSNIVDQDPLWFSHMGDLHYYDPGSGTVIDASLSSCRRAYDDVLLQPEQMDLYSQVAWQYVWDNHDSWRTAGGESDGTFVDKANPQAVYRERVPHYGLPDPEAIYQTWRVGRVQVVALDCRSYRSPNSDPDGPSKTMLGSAQKTWLRGILETSPAEFLVLITTSVWYRPGLGIGSDTWESFPTERAEIVDWLEEFSWIDRMMVVFGDRHAMGMDTGSNAIGGMRAGQFAPLDDSTPSGGADWFDTGTEGDQNSQYGTIRINDLTDRIEVTATGWQGASQWRVMSWTVTLDDGPGPEPPPPAPPAPVAEARIRNSVTWLGVHRTTGKIIADLPDATGDPARQLSGYATSSINVPVTRGGPGHVPVQLLEACTDGASGGIVAVVNDIPMWMGLPTVRDNTMGSIRLQSCPSVDAYLAKRLVRDLSRTDTDRARVALALAQQAEAINGLAGQGLGLEYDVTDTGDLISIEYQTSDRQTHYEAIRDLCVGGLEWTIDLDWADSSQSTIVKILRIRRRIGRVDAAQSMFETGAAGSVISYGDTESWAEGKYANHVTALAPGQGEDQPASAPAIDQAAIDAGVPWVELIVEPGNNITEPDLLDEFAQSQLARVKGGTSALAIDARLDGYPRPGVDAMLGDQVSYLLESDRHPLTATADLRLRGERRMTSMVIRPDQNTWTPGLVEDPLLGVS